MAITLKEHDVDGVGFVANGYSADFSGCESLKAAVTGKSIYVEKVIVNSLTAINYTIGAGETGGAVTAVVLGPIHCAANSTHEIDVSARPIKLAAATALTIDASGGGAATVVVQGYVK